MLSMACADSGSQPAAPGPSTGIRKVDLVISSLLDKDVDALVDLVQFTPQGCFKTPPFVAGGFPTCEAGVPEGSPVQTFLALGCEGTYLTTKQDLQEFFRSFLSAGTQWSLYAVARGQVFYAEAKEGYGIAVTEGSVTSPSAPGLLWHTTEEGEIDDLYVGCGAESIAEMINSTMPGAAYVVGPFQGQCPPGPGGRAELSVQVDKFTSDGFIGSVGTASGERTGEVVRVRVNSATLLEGQAQADFQADVSTHLDSGMWVRVIGQRQDDCSVVAENVLTSEAPTQGN